MGPGVARQNTDSYDKLQNNISSVRVTQRTLATRILMYFYLLITCMLIVLFLKMHFSASRCMNTDEARLVFQKYDEMMKLLHDYCSRVYTSWASRVDVDCNFNLDQPLLLRDKEKNILSVNFNKQANGFHFHSTHHVLMLKRYDVFILLYPLITLYCILCLKLVAVLREVKYLTIQGQEDIPPSAADVFAKHETFRKYVSNLDLIVFWYNEVRHNITQQFKVNASLSRLC